MPKSPADPVLPRSSRPWFLTLLVMGILAVAIVALYVDDASAAVAVWRGSAAHQFSFLVLPISLYFIWLRREDLGRMMPQPSPLLALTAVPFGALWLAADAAQVAFAAQVAVVAFVQVAIVTMVGVQVCRAALFPLLFLWFMVPFGESLLPSLMSMTTTFTVGILNFFGLESVAEGNLFTSGSGEYVIIEDCASLDFLLGNLIISLVFANLMYRGLVRRVIYALAAIPIAIVANLVRTTSVVMITEISGGKVDLALDHGLFGWFIFCIAVMVQMRIGLVYRDSGDDAGRAVGIEAIVVNTNCDPPQVRDVCRARLGAGHRRTARICHGHQSSATGRPGDITMRAAVAGR